jgi:hypothetical protein
MKRTAEKMGLNVWYAEAMQRIEDLCMLVSTSSSRRRHRDSSTTVTFQRTKYNA